MNLDLVLPSLARNPNQPVDLANLSLELARDEYPHLDVEGYRGEVTAMGLEARRYVGGDLRARISGLARYLFHELGFRGNAAEYYDPRNSYLNQVLDRRTGIPISLCAITMAVGQHAGLHVEGIGLPGHFVAKAVADGVEVIFDPFHGGRILTPEDCEDLVRQVSGLDFHLTADSLTPLAVGRIAHRMLANLRGIYLRAEDFSRAARIVGRLRQLEPNQPGHLRDLGSCFLRAGVPGKAIDPLRAYLSSSPEPEDAAAIKPLLQHAQGLIARWN